MKFIFWIYASLLILSAPAFAEDVDFRSVFSEAKPAPPPPSAPKTISPIGYAVRIRVQDGDKKWFGSGVIVSDGVLTCAHVAPRSGLAITVDYRGDESHAQVVKSNLEHDIALLSVAWVKPPASAKLAEIAVRIGDSVTSCGRDKTGELDSQTHKVIGAFRWDKAQSFSYTNPPQQGRSGGGVFNASGEVVGIVHAYSESVDNGIKRREGIAVDLASIKHVLAADQATPEATKERKRSKRRAYAFTGEAIYGAKWCPNCTALKLKWGNGNSDLEIIWSKEVAPGGFPGDDNYPAIRFKGTDGKWLYPQRGDKAATYRIPSSLDDLAGVIDRSGGSFDE